jgi:two-component system, NarL family, sensor histidine kinase UhpB
VNYLAQQSTNNILFDVLMLGIQEQAFLLDVSSMQLVSASQHACQALDIELAALQQLPLPTIIGVSEEVLTAFVSSHQLITQLALPSQSSSVRFYPLNDLNVTVIEADDSQYLLAIKYANSDAANASLDKNDSRFKLLVQNTLGLVFEFQMDKQGIHFDYLSDGCRALLGIEAESLKQSPQQFFAFMDKNDRAILEANIKDSATNLSILNWEGRFWIDEWQCLYGA